MCEVRRVGKNLCVASDFYEEKPGVANPPTTCGNFTDCSDKIAVVFAVLLSVSSCTENRLPEDVLGLYKVAQSPMFSPT